MDTTILTTKDIIKILPFKEDFRMQLLERFDTLNLDALFNIEQALWDAYAYVYDLKIKENLQLAMDKAANGEEKLDEDFYKRVLEKTEKEMEKEAIGSSEKVDLSAARVAMEKIVKEIQASKKKKASF